MVVPDKTSAVSSNYLQEGTAEDASTTRVQLPLGTAFSLGLTFNGFPPIVTTVSDASPLINQVEVGQGVISVAIPGQIPYFVAASDEVTTILNNSSAVEGRYILLQKQLSPEDASGELIYPQQKLSISGRQYGRMAQGSCAGCWQCCGDCECNACECCVVS